jgi:hypothetical protein
MKQMGASSKHGSEEKCIQSSGRKTGRKQTLGRPRHRWEDSIKIDPEEIRWQGVNWIHLSQDMEQRRALVNTVMNLQVPQKAGNSMTSCATIKVLKTDSSQQLLMTGWTCSHEMRAQNFYKIWVRKLLVN